MQPSITFDKSILVVIVFMNMPEADYPMAVVSKRTGLSPQLLRAWESRHAAVSPRRNKSGRRVYTRDDIVRLQRLQSLTSAGFPISRIAHLSAAALEDLVTREFAEAAIPASTSGVSSSGAAEPSAFVADAMGAISRLDSDALLRALECADVTLGKPKFLEEVVAKIAEHVGEAWRSGQIKIAHEHFATAQLRGYLGPFGRVPHLNAATPHLIVTTPSEQWHELGALLVAAAAHSHGWGVTYLGPSMPVEEIAGAALGFRARAVALSIIYPVADPQLPKELSRLRRLLPESTALLIGGRGSSACSLHCSDIGAHHLTSLRDLYPLLDELHNAPASHPRTNVNGFEE